MNFFFSLLSVYNGTGASEGIRKGCERIQHLFEDWFNENELAFDLTPFNGRSDYGPFIEAGIPAGGLFTGAEEIKTMEGRAKYGGMANTAYDPCYHQDCDTIENVNVDVLLQMAKAAASTLETLALEKDLRGWLKS